MTLAGAAHEWCTRGWVEPGAEVTEALPRDGRAMPYGGGTVRPPTASAVLQVVLVPVAALAVGIVGVVGAGRCPAAERVQRGRHAGLALSAL